MYGFFVVLTAETASFRDPSGQLYHATFPLPPVSTIVGIAGAAMGIPFQKVWNFFQDNSINVGVKDITSDWRNELPGKGLDLWGYRKIKNNEVGSDILKREFLFRPVFKLCYGSENEVVLNRLRQAFLAPAWALSLGTSDDIARLENVSQIKIVEEVDEGATKLSCSLIPGDQTDNYDFNWEFISNASIGITLELPLVKQLPMGFEFRSTGERKGSNYMPFTFLSDIQHLKNPICAYIFGQDTLPLIPIE